MSTGATSRAIESACSALKQAFGDDLVSIYLYGSLAAGYYQSGDSDINLLVVLNEGFDIHHLRNIFRPIWHLYGQVLKKSPLVASKTTLTRHIHLNPLFGHHLAATGQLIEGSEFLPDLPRVESIEELARISRSILSASAAVAPSMLSELEADETIAALRSLVRQLFHANVDADANVEQMLAKVQQELLSRLEAYPDLHWKDSAVADAPPLLADLRAVYEKENRLLLVLPDLSPENMAERITSIDWPEVVSRVHLQYRGLRITTPTEFRIMLIYDAPADVQLESYDHAWGLDPIGDLDISQWRVDRDLGRLPSDLQLATLPHAYITTDDADIAMLIHDLQNKLLNIQLRSERQNRMQNRPVVIPSIPLPDRNESTKVRIAAINDHLDWWASHYADAMLAELSREPS